MGPRFRGDDGKGDRDAGGLPCPYSGVMPASLTTCAHFLISAGMNCASSSGVLVQGVIASAFILSWISGRLMKVISTRLSLSIIGRGVPAGATTENHGVPP